MFAYNDRGWAWQAKRDFDKALEDFNQARSICSEVCAGADQSRIVWTAKKEFDKAIEDFDHAIEIDPQRV